MAHVLHQNDDGACRPSGFRVRLLESKAVGSSWAITQTTDNFQVHSNIFVRIYHHESSCVVINTGCGPCVDHRSDGPYRTLRRFIERFPVPENRGLPLNPNGTMKYTVILSSCVYYNILGVHEFSHQDGHPVTIYASGYDSRIIDPQSLPSTSGCLSRGLTTPNITITPVHNIVDRDNANVIEHPLIIHSLEVRWCPGIRPDELVVCDTAAKILYTFDSLPQMKGLFLQAGLFNLSLWHHNLELLLYVQGENEEIRERTYDDILNSEVSYRNLVVVSAGEEEATKNAEEVILAAIEFTQDLLGGKRTGIKSVYDQWPLLYTSNRLHLDLLAPQNVIPEGNHQKTRTGR